MNYGGDTCNIPIPDEQDMIENALYPAYLADSDLNLGVKQGKFFQAMIMMSRLTLEEATVNVQGANEPLLVIGSPNMNRATNADIVIVEVLPRDKWISNYKPGEPSNWLNEDEPAINVDE